MGFHSKEYTYTSSSWGKQKKQHEEKKEEDYEIEELEILPAPEEQDQRAAFEKLPAEIYDQIFGYLIPDEPVSGYKRRNSDLSSVLKVSRTLYAATLFTIFQNAQFPHSPVYSKWLNQITNYPALGGLVRRMDFSTYTSVGLGRTGKMNMELPNLTATTLVKGLRRTHNLREFLAQEALGPDVGIMVIETLFNDLPLLEAVDFCGAVAARFREAFSEVMHPWNPRLQPYFPIKRLSLHECSTIPTKVFEALLPRLPNLTHLDLSHTQVTDSALQAIPKSARITHLSLAKCARLTGEHVVTFLLEHPAVQTTLQVLNLHYDASRYRLLSAIDVEDLLPCLPKSLVSLNITGSTISSEQMPFILPLVSRLEELSLGQTDLTMEDINSIFAPQWKSNLKFLDISGIAAVTPNSLLYSNTSILQPISAPLEVLEMSEKIVTGLGQRSQTTKRYGWSEETYGRRAWLVRKTIDGDKLVDDGSREWKMGSKKWGNRKIPCNYGEVGGTYAYYGLGK